MALICRHVDRLSGYTPGEQPHFAGMIKLNTNENPYPPTPHVGEALQQFDYQQLRLYPDPLFMRVREEIAALNGCSVEQVFVGNGSDEVLALITRAFVEAGGTVGYQEPTYSLYSVLAEIRDAVVKPYPLAEDFTWQEPPADWSDLFLLTNPNAPTGLQTGFEAVAGFCERFHGLVVIDEAYADFAPFTCMDLATDPAAKNVLVMRTLSKSYSLAGVRFGYAVGPAHLIEALYKIKDSYNMDALAQVVGLAALQDQAHMRANVDKIVATRTWVADALARAGWQIVPSAANFLFAKPPQGDTAALFKHLHDLHLYVRYFPGPLTGDYLRITMGTDAQMDALLTALNVEHAR